MTIKSVNLRRRALAVIWPQAQRSEYLQQDAGVLRVLPFNAQTSSEYLQQDMSVLLTTNYGPSEYLEQSAAVLRP